MAKIPKNTSKRFTVTFSDDSYEKLKYWSEKYGISMSQFLEDGMHLYISHKNGDYDLPTLEAQRLNEIIDALTSLSHNTKSLEGTVIYGFNSLLKLTRGDNYLLYDEGEGEVYGL